MFPAASDSSTDDSDHIPAQAFLAPKTVGARLISRDEMNLAEFPLTVLSTRCNPALKTLEFRDTVIGKNGEKTEREWIITGADKFGLPTASDDEILLGLLKLTVDDGFTAQKVYFTRYELLKVLRWTTEGRSYTRLQNGLDRLSGVRIKATNAFFDNESKSHRTKNFGIVDAYEINDGRSTSPKPSFFVWSEELFKSFHTGFIKKLDLDFYLNLESAITKRLYRYLDKHFWYKAKFRINLFTLAHEKIGVSRNYRFASSLRQQLDRPIQELIERGFLSGCEFTGKGKQTEAIFFAASGKPRVNAGPVAASPEEAGPQTLELPLGDSALGNSALGDSGQTLHAQVFSALVSRGIRAPQSNRLLHGRSSEELERMLSIINYFDNLVSSSSKLVSKSPIGFLYRAIENPQNFVLPEERESRQREFAFSKPKPLQNIKRVDSDNLESGYLIARKLEIEKLRGSVEPNLMQKVDQEVRSALSKIRSHISEERFEEAVKRGVDEKLATLFVLPTFDEWKKERGK